MESAVNEGAQFTIYLPVIDQPAIVIKDDQKPPARGAGETILLVEDEAALRGAMAEMLTELGYQVMAAENGRHALLLFGEHKPAIDLVISDLVMPDMGGEELYQQLAQAYSGHAPLRMLLVTGYPVEDEDRWRTGNAITNWLQKPFTVEALAQRVAETLREQPVAAE